MYLLTSSFRCVLQSKLGNPCDKFSAFCSLAKADITENIEVPDFGNLEEIESGLSIKIN
jgi:hypothetical protein